MPRPRTQQANLPACSPQPPLNAERQAGKLRMPFFKVFWYDSTRGMNPRPALALWGSSFCVVVEFPQHIWLHRTNVLQSQTQRWKHEYWFKLTWSESNWMNLILSRIEWIWSWFLIKCINWNNNASFYVLGHFAARQTEPCLAIRLSHPVLLQHDM